MDLRNIADIFSDDSELTEMIRSRPVTAVAVSAAAGFIWGGGAGGRFGRALLIYIGQALIRESIVNVVSNAVINNGRNPRGNRERTGRSSARA